MPRLSGTALVLLALFLPGPANAADPQPYTVQLGATDNAALDTALRESSSLISLRETAPVGPFALITRAMTDKDRLQAALGSFGYYGGSVAIRIAGRPVDDPSLPQVLDAARGPVEVSIAVTRGPEYTLRRIQIVGTTDPAALAEARAVLRLEPGQPAVAAEVVAAQGRMLAALRDAGRPLAKVETPIAVLEPGARALDITYRIEPGPKADLGPIAIEGLEDVNASFVRRRLLIAQGQVYDPVKIEAARQDLAQLGVFATVTVVAGDKVDAAGQIPITVTVTERPRHVVGVNVAYSTDLGASAGVTWADRNLFGNAERLDLGAAVTQLGGSASRGQGYNVTAALTKPDVFVRNQSVTVSLQGIKENLEAYDRTAALAGIQVNRKLSEAWTVGGGVLAQQSRITQEGVTRDYTLVGLPLTAKYDSTGPAGLLEPIKGMKASFVVTPTASLRGGTNFVILQATASTYINLGAPGRSVLALRGTVGSIQGATTFLVPPDQRFYAGGSGTVRGYKYQSVGPLFPSNRPTGGTSLGAATVEFRQRFGESLGAVMFVDAGQVGTDSAPFTGDLRLGAGVGARYYTPIGPIRLDVALPLTKQRGGRCVRVVHRHRAGVLMRRVLGLGGRRPAAAAAGAGWRGVFALLNLDVGRRLVETQAESLTGGMVRIAGLSGRFPDALRIGRLELRDADGPYFDGGVAGAGLVADRVAASSRRRCSGWRRRGSRLSRLPRSAGVGAGGRRRTVQAVRAAGAGHGRCVEDRPRGDRGAGRRARRRC